MNLPVAGFMAVLRERTRMEAKKADTQTRSCHFCDVYLWGWGEGASGGAPAGADGSNPPF